MASLFTNSEQQTHSGSFRADDLKLNVGGDAKGALVQQVNFTMNRTVNMLYEIGSTNVYYVGNRRQGQCQMQRIVGGSGTMAALIKTYGDMCNPAELTLTASGGCGPGGGGSITYSMTSATLTTIGASVTAQDIVVTESLGFIFADLSDGAAG